MLKKVPIMREPEDVSATSIIGMFMENVHRIYQIEHDYEEKDRLEALKDYILEPAYPLVLFIHGDIPNSITYEELRDKLMVNVVAERVSDALARSKIQQSEYTATQIQKFFESIKPKESNEDKGHDVMDLLDKFDLKWDTVKNFKRHDPYETDGIVKSKTDKIKKITYVYRDPSKAFYGRVDYLGEELSELIDNYDEKHYLKNFRFLD